MTIHVPYYRKTCLRIVLLSFLTKPELMTEKIKGTCTSIWKITLHGI